MKKIELGVFACAAAALLTAGAETMDRPSGFKIGQHMTLKPYVDLSFVYDSNIESLPDGAEVCSWVINPGLSLNYQGENWMLDLNAFYRYIIYSRHINNQNEHNYGENLNYKWADSRANEKGWSLILTESYQKINEGNEVTENEARGLWRDRQMFNISGAVERRITDKFHGDVNASYYWLDYDNAGDYQSPMFGWQRWTVGAELGYAASQWTDLLLAGNYQGYIQDNTQKLDSRYSDTSFGYAVMAGFGTYATDRISYRVLAGWSRFEYGDVSTDDGFIYSISANWKISDTLQTMLLAQSSYQPSEREYGSANRIDTISWGVGKSLVRGKLNATMDIAYRRETRTHTDENSRDYDEDIFSIRAGLNYAINRFLVAFGRFEYQGTWFDGYGMDRDYDRFRFTTGVRLTY